MDLNRLMAKVNGTESERSIDIDLDSDLISCIAKIAIHAACCISLEARFANLYM